MPDFRHILLVACWYGAGSASGFAGVVSTSLCADSYVQAIADPADIQALSWQADGPLSRAAPNLRQLPKARANAEILLTLAPSHVVLGPGDSAAATNLSQTRGAKVFALNWQDDFAGVSENLLALGGFLQRQIIAQALIHDQQARLQALAQRSKARTKPAQVLYLTPTLGTAGAGTFIDAVILAAGGENLATKMGIAGWGQVPLEVLLAQQPDLIITSFFKHGPPSVLQFRANHSLVKAVLKRTPQIQVSGGLWVCAGPLLIVAAEKIADELDAL
ncbi:MAG: ABC transporter substrate-binding protein [Robiginitomaculum sp.]|nr:ABC transporter substrate-binding protein [Robiginitomaculum sp.]